MKKLLTSLLFCILWIGYCSAGRQHVQIYFKDAPVFDYANKHGDMFMYQSKVDPDGHADLFGTVDNDERYSAMANDFTLLYQNLTFYSSYNYAPMVEGIVYDKAKMTITMKLNSVDHIYFENLDYLR